MGRSYKTVLSQGGGRQSIYDNLGELTQEIDPDNFVTRYAYNTKGELEVTALDLDGQSGIQTNGTDRISSQVREVSLRGSTYVQRTQNYLFTNNATSPTLLSALETSCDGLQTWQTVYKAA